MNKTALPDLPFNAWKESLMTLHLIFQIVGKVRLKLTPRKNHWWYITHYVTPRGFSTHSIPVEEGLHSLEIEINLKQRAVILSHSDREEVLIPLMDDLSIAQFYKRFMASLAAMDLHPEFIKKPFDLPIKKPFEEIEEYHHFNWEYIHRFWSIMRWNNALFQKFSGRYYGKTCPVHIYWHHLDLTVTRISNKKLPPMGDDARILEKEAYSHEQISFGFWAGDENVQEPMYYAYAYPSPEGIDQETLRPESAFWQDSNGSPMALLRYEDVRKADDPAQAVLDFLESVYQAGAKHLDWDVEALKVPDLEDL